MGKGPKVSIIVPIYNVEKYISLCLTSVINQTLIDIEIICVNDGTKDNSCNIVNVFMEEDSRIKLIHKKNGGLSSARNAGLKIATGDYIWFVDSDDYIENMACERLYLEIIEDKPDIIAFGSNTFPVMPWVDPWVSTSLSPRTCKYMGKDVVKALFFENGAVPYVWRNCFKREFLEKNKLLFNENVKFGEDTIFQFEAFSCASNLTFISDKLYNYRHYRPGSLMNQYNNNQYEKIKCHIDIVDIIANYWNKNETLVMWKKQFFEWSLDFVGYDLQKYVGYRQLELYHLIYDIWQKYDLLKYKNVIESYRKHYLVKICKSL